jgi:hypothetical protein
MVVAVNNPALNTLQQILINDIEIDGELLNVTPSELRQVQISNAENKHESAIITTQLTKTQIDRFIGKTITFKYGPKFSGNTFYGYVIVINPNQDYQQDTIVDIICLGATWPLQTGKPRFFVNRNAPSVFGEVVKEHRLGCQVDGHSYVWPALSQTTESDWEFIQTLAMRVGYCIYVYNGIVRMVNPIRILSETGISHRLIRSDDVLDPSRQLLDFNPSTQSLRIRDNVKPSFGYFDGTTPRLSQPTDSVPYRMSTDTPIRDKGMSDTYTEAWERRIDFWNQKATARVNGNVSIIPGINVSVQISGNPSGRNEYDGTWLVRGVSHSFTNNSFQTLLELARDASNTRAISTDFREFVAQTTKGSPNLVKAVIGNKTLWESTWHQVEVISDKLYEPSINTITIPEDIPSPVTT